MTIGLQTLDDRAAHCEAIQQTTPRPKCRRKRRRWGIKHVNIDLMTGLPEQSLQSQDDLSLFVFDPDSVHIPTVLCPSRFGTTKAKSVKEEFVLREQMNLKQNRDCEKKDTPVV